MSKTCIFGFVYCCTIGLLMQMSVTVAKYENQAKIHIANGGLALEAATDRNITVRLGRDSAFLLNGVDIMEKIRHRYTPTTLDRDEAKLLNVPSTEQITNEVHTLRDDLERLSHRFSLMQNRTRSPTQLGAIRRSLGRLRRLSGRLLALEQNIAKNECHEASSPCKNGGTCYDSYKGFHCECTEGWTGKTCQDDADECYLLAGTDLGCQNNAICTNTLGGYKCTCAKGFVGTHCRLRNTVCQQYQSEELCGHGICVPANNQQGFTCICEQGWTHNTTATANTSFSLMCDMDVNECEESRNPCHSECINLPGSFKCGPCPAGYTGNGKTCIDIDECTTNNGGCSSLPKVRCINTEGSYRCGNCPHGWTGDGHSCDLALSNSCDAEQFCHPQAKCVYISDMATCTCTHGMFGHGFGPDGCHTTPITDSCENHICKNNGTCVSTGRSTSCLCPLGYFGALCETADGCHPNPCENSGNCRPLANQSYKCTCNRGTTGKRCEVLRSVCGSVQRRPSGELSYPSDGAPEYASFEKCAWIIRTSPSNILNLTFISFDVQEETSTECIHDWLEIHDGNSLASQLIGRFCGHELPLGGNILSSQHQLLFWFRSDNVTNRRGFQMKWQSQPHICGDSLEVRVQDDGVIRSPGYPGKTATNRECQWEFSAPYGYRFVIRIYEVNLGSSSNCSGDSLKIYDADLLLNEFCTSSSPQPLRSSSNKIGVHFHTDSNGIDSSFQLHYEVEPSVPHCGGVFTDTSGLIVGPSEESVCLYLVQQPVGTQIQLEFMEMEPFEVENCNIKSIEIFDGNTDEDSQLAAICNGMKPNPVVSSSNYILIRYKNKLRTENHTPPFRVKYTRVCEFRYFGPDAGVFTTPNYPKPYAEQITCTFHIYGPAETAVLANFTDFNIAETKAIYVVDYDDTTQGLLNNQTTLTDQPDDESKTYVDVYLSDSNKRRYMKGAPMELISELNKMTIIFHAAMNPTKARGIRVEYTFEPVSCGGVYTETKGTFDKNLRLSGECKFIFEAPEGKDIRISFGMVSLEDTHQVYVYGNASGGGAYLLKNISSYSFFEETFHFNVITLFTHKKAILIMSEYEFVDREEGCGGNFSTLYGVIKTPSWPGSYAADLDCVWIVTAPLGSKIELTVQNFTLESTCTGDVLEIRNGMFSNSPLIGRYCGNEIPSRIPSFTNSLYLRFTSDNSVEGLGFHITWEQSESGCGGKLTSFKGSIHSPQRGVQTYTNLYVTCDWTIHVADGSSVVISVMPSMDFVTFCRSNRLQIYDGSTASKPLLNLNCTETEKSGRITVTSSSNEVLVVYIPSFEHSVDFILDYETNCKMLLDHVQGVIESPNFPELYPDLLNCNWDIRAGVNNKLKLAFSHLSLEADNMECVYDYVEVLDMKNEDILQKHHLCTDIPAPIISDGNRLVIRFVTDYSNAKNGFRAEYSRLGCGEFLTSEFSTIQPPNYPYSIDLDCDWYIEVPAGKQIVFSIFELKIDTDTPDCSDTMLLVKESKNASQTMLKECATQQMPSMITSPANQLYLNFRSGPSRSRKYFKALYHTKDASCGGVFRGSSGIINSPNYPNNSTEGYNCKWEINVPESYGIVLKFNDFEISSSRNCSDAYLRFSELSGQTQTLLKQYCGTGRPEMNPVRSGRLIIEYMNKGTENWGRFSMEFEKQCGGVITGGSGLIRSHPGEECMWTFNVTAGSLISLNILQLDCYCTKDDQTTTGCRHKLEFVENISDEEITHNTFCEDHRSNLVFEKTILNIIARKINFRAKYSTTQHSCGGTITSDRGSIASPYYPETYPPNVECTWTLQIARGNSIQLQIIQMDIARSEHCNEDYLEIRTMSTNKILGIYCGNEEPDDLLTSYQTVWIRFHSSEGSTGNGFKLSWNYGHLNEIGNDTNGFIDSPPIRMARNDEEPFAWRILLERDNYVSLIFNQYIDGLRLYDGFDDTALPVVIPASPWRFVSSSNVVFLKTDNDKLQYFSIKWNKTNNKVVDTNTTMSKCHTELYIKSQSHTVVTSPGYPHGYEPNLKCEWIFKPVNTIEHVVCEVYVAKLETTNSCVADYLKISTSTDLIQWHEMQKLCNSSEIAFKPFAIFHGTPHIKLDFVSDTSLNGTGFSTKIRTRCGSNLTDSVGFIQGDTLMYEQDCLWQIVVKQTKRIRLHLDFASTIVSNVNECREYALIYDGMDEHAPLLPPGKICNPQNVSRLLLNSTSNYLTIKYNLTLPKPHMPKRWNLTYREYSECNEEYRLIPEAPTINVSSPNYPNIPHPHTECDWRVIAPRGELIQVEFVDRFDMNSRFCSLEFLEMFDGSTSLGRSMGRFCRKPPILKTTQNILFMRYQTDIREPRSGFRARISISKCGGSYSDASGQISSPGYPSPGAYPSSTQCDFVINLPEDATIHLVATDIHMPLNKLEPRTSDYLEIIPIGDNLADTNPIFVYGNTTKGSFFELTVNKAIVRFHTFGKNTQYRGFSLKYSRFRALCMQDVTRDTGVLTMHFPKIAYFSSFCRWKITVPKGQRVRLDFLNLNDLKGQNATRYPSFAVFNDHEMLSKLTSFNANTFDPNTVIQSSDNIMLVRIHVPLNDFQFKTIRARYTSDEISPCPADIGDDNLSGIIDIQDTQPIFNGNYYCIIRTKLSGEETLVFNITSFENMRTNTAPKIQSPLVFRDQLITTSYRENLTHVLQPHTQAVGYVRIMQSEAEHIHRLRMDYRRHKCGGYVSVLSNVDLQQPATTYIGYGPIMCVWTLAKPFWAGRSDSEFQLSGNFTFTDSCDREFVLIQEGQWKGSEPSKKICKDNNEQLQRYTFTNRLTYITYQSQDYNHEKTQFSMQIRKSIMCGSEVKVTQISSTVEVKKDAYKNNQECSWVFFTTPGFYLQLQFFDRFFIEDSPNCTKDYLEIQRFEEGLWFPEARFCGREFPETFNASTTRIRVVWHTNDVVTADGFSFFVRNHCSVTLNVTTGVQQIVSPTGFGYGGRRLQCEYIFQSNDTDKLINIRSRLATGTYYPTTQCRSGGFLVYKRDGTGAEQAGERHCELEFEERALKYLKVNYDSLLMVKYTIEYALDTCGGNITTSPTTIRPLKHEQNNMYADNMNCVWFVVAPADHSIAIRFKYFDTEKNFDHVSIYSGAKIQIDNRQAKLTGNLTENPPSIVVDHNQAVINAVSDASNSHKGFEAQIVFIPNCNERISLTDGNSPVTLARVFRLSGEEECVCMYRVTAPKNHRIRIGIKKLIINNSTSRCFNSESKCESSCNAIEAFDSAATEQAPMGRFCMVPRSNSSLMSSYEDAMLKFTMKVAGQYSLEIILTMEKSVCGEITEYKLGESEVLKFSFPQNGESSYAPNVHCTWRFRSDYWMQFHFNNIDLQNASQVTGKCLDYIEIKSAFSSNQFCGHTTNYRTCAERYHENEVEVTFHSDASVEGKGVELLIHKENACNRTYNELNGLIRYEVVISPQPEICKDTIIVPENYTLNLYVANMYFTNFDCGKLHFRVTDLKTNKTLVDRCQNSYGNFDVFTSTNAVRLEAKDYTSITLFYTASERTETPGCGATLRASEGYLSSPSYENDRNFSECRWDIILPAPNTINIYFYAFNMGSSTNCPLDNVRLIDILPDGTEKMIKTLCGSQSPLSTLSSTSNHMALISKKSPNFDGIGWHVHYQMERIYNSAMRIT